MPIVRKFYKLLSRTYMFLVNKHTIVFLYLNIVTQIISNCCIEFHV